MKRIAVDKGYYKIFAFHKISEYRNIQNLNLTTMYMNLSEKLRLLIGIKGCVKNLRATSFDL